MPLVVFVMNSPKGMVAVLPIARRSELPVDADVALPFLCQSLPKERWKLLTMHNLGSSNILGVDIMRYIS